MRPVELKTKIFLDSGNPQETREAIKLLGFLDGQTTNPTLIVKNPLAQERLARGEKFEKEEILDFYRKVVTEISGLIPQGSVSIETYADLSTSADDMFSEAKGMFSWIPNAHIKYPTTKEGLAAAEISVKEGMRVNMTLCFSQEQAAAVYAATKGAKKGDVFVSPFVGRLDDIGKNGMDLIANILRMYGSGAASVRGEPRPGEPGRDGHVEVLSASVRNMDHFMEALKLGSDIITAPFAVLKEWAERGLPAPASDYVYNRSDLKPIPYKQLDLTESWQKFDIEHELTRKGIERFSSDWNTLIMSA